MGQILRGRVQIHNSGVLAVGADPRVRPYKNGALVHMMKKTCPKSDPSSCWANDCLRTETALTASFVEDMIGQTRRSY